MLQNQNNCPQILLKHRDSIAENEVLSQSIDFNIYSWNKYFKKNKEFNRIIKKIDRKISRKDIGKLAKQAVRSKKIDVIKMVFLSSMIWGFGKTGYGPYRTSIMLSQKNATNILKMSFSSIITGELQDAYNAFSLPMCGPAFFTKYFYFLGLGTNLDTKPLILDSLVAKAIDKTLKLEISDFASVVRDKKNNIISIRHNASAYQYYCEKLNHWSGILDCRADSIEYFLFQIGKQKAK